MIQRPPSLAAEPIMIFHEADAGLIDYRDNLVVLVLGGVPVVGLPIKWLIEPSRWPPDTVVVVMWLLLTAAVVHMGALAPLRTELRRRRGEKAGLRIAEAEDHVEIVFFVGDRPKRVERFAYADIVDVGCDRFPFGPFGGYETLPFVAIRGPFGIVKKHPIRPRIGGDMRNLCHVDPHRIAADIDRAVRRHVDLPEPEKPLSQVVDENAQAFMGQIAARWEKMERQAEERKGRFLGIDWTRVALALSLVVGAKLAFLNELLGIRFLSAGDVVTTAILFLFVRDWIGAPLSAWRRRARASASERTPDSSASERTSDS